MQIKDLIKYLSNFDENLEVVRCGEYEKFRLSEHFYPDSITEVIPFSRKTDGSCKTRKIKVLIINEELIMEP